MIDVRKFPFGKRAVIANNVNALAVKDLHLKRPFQAVKLLGYLVVGLSFIPCSQANAQGNIDFPVDAGMANVQSYGAIPNDGQDDTTAFQNAISDNVRERPLYVPNGVYNISKRLEVRNEQGEWEAYFTLQGQSRAGTILRLTNNSTDFQSTSAPRAVLHTASQVTGAPFDATDGTGFAAFNNFISDLTIDTGTGNPGAIGIHFMSNNVGAMRNVTIKSGNGQGISGISMLKYPGPCLLKNIEIEGFNYGINIAGTRYSLVGENITLKNQLIAGINNSNNIITIRGLNSQNSVPAIKNPGYDGFLTLMDVNCTGGAAGTSAIETLGQMYARNISASGYASVVKYQGATVAGTSLSEYVTTPAFELFPSPDTALKLPIENTPYFHDNPIYPNNDTTQPPTNWANVRSYKLTTDPDDTLAIQRAIDSGKPTVYFPPGDYIVSNTISIRNNVRKLRGFSAAIKPTGSGFNNTSALKVLFNFENGTPDTVILQGLFIYAGTGTIQVQHAASRTLVMVDTRLEGSTSASFITYRNTSVGTGKLFLEDVYLNRVRIEYPQQVWGRHVNTEYTDTMFRNKSASLWILGIKTEQPATVIETTDGGKTELLGGVVSPYAGVSSTLPAFINNESSVSLSYASEAGFNSTAHQDYTVHIKEIRGGVTKTLQRSSLVKRISVYAAQVPLYTGYGTAPPASTGTGLTGEYYDDPSWSSLRLIRTDPTIDFNWGSASPDPIIAADTFRVRWTGFIQPLYSQTYTFYIYSDDGIRMTLNNQNIIDSWSNGGSERTSTPIALIAGQKYPVTIEYYENTGSASARLSWSSSSQAKVIIPQSQLYPAATGTGVMGLRGTPASAFGVEKFYRSPFQSPQLLPIVFDTFKTPLPVKSG